MEHARKYLLLPADREQQFAEEHLSNLDSQMQTILSKKNVDENEKVQQYLQVLQKYVTFPELSAKQEISEQREEKERSPEEDIVSSAPVKHKEISKKIIQFLNNHKDLITWSPSKELILKGTVLPGTNVETLINFLLRDRRKKPKGYGELKSLLDEIHFPEDFVKNKHLNSVKTLYARPRNVKKKPRAWLKL